MPTPSFLRHHRSFGASKFLSAFHPLPVLLFIACAVLAPPPVAAQETDAPEVSENDQTADSEESAADDSPSVVSQRGDEIVVTATRIASPVGEVGSSITVITREEIERRKEPYVLDLLRTVPGVDVVQTGGPGRSTSIFIRGAKSDQTLVLLDGIELGDPISVGRAFDLSTLTVDGVERIEILRGPQSTLYGSDAMGGVINIITQRGQPGFHTTADVEGGSFGTVNSKLGIRGASERFNYAFGVSRFRTDGFSAASESAGNTENDGSENTTLSGRIGFTTAEVVDWDFTLRWVETEIDIDNSAGAGGDDPNHVSDNRQLFLRGGATFSLFDGLWEQEWSAAITDHDRRTTNPIDVDHPVDRSISTFDSQLIKFGWQNNLHLRESNTLIVGIETEEERGNSFFFSDGMFGPFTSILDEKRVRTTGYYVQDQFEIGDAFHATLGARIDDHETFGSHVTYRATASYLFDGTNTRLRGSVGTGFKAPTIFQLFSSFGSPTLRPEKSLGWDVGVEQAFLDDTLAVGLTYFQNDFDTLILFDSATSTFANINAAETSGVEVSLVAQLTETVDLQAAYTYTDTKDETTGLDLFRRPRNKVAANLNWAYSEKGTVNLNAVYVGERDNNDFSTFPAIRTRVDGYTLVNLTTSYDISDSVQAYGRIDNVFDEDYEEVLGFGTAPLSAYLGLRLSFGGGREAKADEKTSGVNQ